VNFHMWCSWNVIPYWKTKMVSPKRRIYPQSAMCEVTKGWGVKRYKNWYIVVK